MIAPFLSASMITAFAADSRGVSEEARQTAAQVRASLLTHDWTWLHGGLLNRPSQERVDRYWSVFMGLARWTVDSPNFDALQIRICATIEASTLGPPWVGTPSILSVLQEARKPETSLEGLFYGSFPMPSFPCVCSSVPAWGARPGRRARWDPKKGEYLFSWDNRRGYPVRVGLRTYDSKKYVHRFEVRQDIS
jgi:hypothetical protein